MKRTFAALFLVAFAFAGWWSGGLLLAQEQSAKSLVEKMLEDVLAAEGRSVGIEGLSISLNGDVSVDRVEVRDGTEPWLVMEKLELDWQPLSLFRSKLDIDSLSIERVDLTRLPQTGEGGVAAPKEMTGLSNADIKDLSIHKFRIGREVLGQDAEIKVAGAAQIVQSPPEIRFRFNAERTDGKEGKLAAGTVLDPRSRQLDVDLGLDEGPDGLVAGLLKLRGVPSTGLTLAAKGTIDDWSGKFNLALDGKPVIAGDATSAADKSGRRLTINGSGMLESLAPPGLARVLRGNSQLAATIAFPGAGGVADIQRFHIDNEAYQLRVSGPVDWTGSGTNVALELRAKSDTESLALPELSGLGAPELTGLNAHVGITGQALSPHWAVTASASSLSADPASFKDFSLGLTGNGIDPSKANVALEGTLRGIVEPGRASALPPALNGTMTAHLSALWKGDGLVDLVPMELSVGSLSLAARGTVNPSSAEFNFEVAADAESPVSGFQVLDRLLHGAVKAEGSIRRDLNGSFAVRAFKLSSADAAAELDGEIDRQQADLRTSLTINDLGLIDSRLTGSAGGNLSLRGPWSRLVSEIDANGSGIKLIGKQFEDPELKARLVLSELRPEGALDFSARLQDKPVTLTARLETAADGTRVLRGLSAVSNTSTLTGELQLPASGAPAGNFTLASPDLRDIGPLLLMSLSGSADARIDLQPFGEGGRAQVTFMGRNIQSPQLAAAQAEGTITIESPFDQPRPSGRISLVEVKIGDYAFSAISGEAKSTGTNSYDLLLKADGRELSAETQLGVSSDREGTTATVEHLVGSLRGIPLQATAPFSLRQTGNEFSVSDAAFAVGAGRAVITGRIMPDMDAQLKLDGLPLAPFEKLSGVQGLAGTVSGSARLGGTRASPAGRFDILAKDITFAALRQLRLEPVSFTSRGKIENQTVNFAASGSAGSGTGIEVDGAIGLAVPSEIDIRVRGKTDGRWLTERLAASGIRLEAQSEFDLRLVGRANQPSVSGSINLSNATLGDTAGRFLVRQADGRFTVADNVLRIASLQGITGRKGRASFSGSLSLAGDLQADIKAQITNAIYTDGSFVTTQYDGNLTLAGPLLGAPTLGGEIGLENTKITLSSLPPRAIQAPDVRHRHAPRTVSRQAAALRQRQGRGGGDILLSLVLRAADPISVSGRGLNVTLGGKLVLAGSLSNIAPQGAFRLERGSLKLLARRLDFESGRLDFDSGLDPRINFVAVSRRTDATITLTIAGRVSTPNITVTSSPQLPQEEAMARLMFDRSMLQLSPLQIAQIASYVATLSGGRETGLLGGLQNALGTGWLDIVQTESGETAVSFGKQISERLSIGAEQTTQSNTSRAIIDFGITSHLKARGSYGTDGSSRAGVYFQKDY
jgi:translocation and assembly module TamB